MTEETEIKTEPLSEDRIYRVKKKCSKCGISYGSDYKKDNGFCPICERKVIHGNRFRFRK